MTNNDAVTDPLLGQQLDEYRLDKMLKEGGMGRVYLGYDIRLERGAAVKVIRPSSRATSDYKARFKREAQAIARLNHPHIVGVYRYGQVNDLFYLAMTYIKGVDLQTRLDDYREKHELMPSSEISRIIGQVCQALDYAHSQNVIHRDVKPANIMITPDGKAILTDFGLALLDRSTLGETFGTPEYIAPEQAMSSAKAVAQSDLYSVGVILYEMFTNQLPFESPDRLSSALQHINEMPPSPSSINSRISPELEAVLLKALAKEPGNRYPSGAALVEALEQALQAGPPKLIPPLPPLPAPVFKLPTLRYLWKNIRILLVEGFSAEELSKLCFDEFRPVYNQLSPRSGKAEIAELLLQYTDQTLQVDTLLALLKERNPARYEKHQPYSKEFIPSGPRSLINTNLAHYYLSEWLGQGGVAEVYKAHDSHLNRYVAIKVIDDDLINDADMIERFTDEAITLARLRHAHIVQIIDHGQTEGIHYIVMEFIPGGNLKDKIQQRRDHGQSFTPAEAVPIFKDLASALDYIHSQGVVHHDLKPNNILFNAAGQVVLTDFGVARVTTVPSCTISGAILGTPAYMAPEQIKGQRGEKRSDIYSLGVILYEMLTGRLPFEAKTPWDMFLKSTTEAPPAPVSLNSAIVPAVERVILTTLNKKPEERYQTAGEMAEALAKALVPQPLDAPPDFIYDVFVSYHRVDRDWVVRLLLPCLEGAGLRVCLSGRDIEPGPFQQQVAAQAVETSRKTLMVLTPAYVANELNEFENSLSQAMDPAARQRRLIPLLKEPCDLPSRLKYLVPVDFVDPITPDLPWTQLLKALVRR